MSTLQFPASPFPGQSFTAENGVTYTYDSAGGGGWTATNPVGIDDEYVNIDGDTMTGDLVLPNLEASGNISADGDIQSTSQNGGQLAGFRNQIINGSFQCWQRSLDITSTGSDYKTADRWYVETKGANTVSKRIDIDTTTNALKDEAPTTYGMRLHANGAPLEVRQCIELEKTGAAGIFKPGTKWFISWYSDLRNGSTGNDGTFIDCRVAFMDNATDAGNNTEIISPLTNLGGRRWGFPIEIQSTPPSTATCLRIDLVTANVNEFEFTAIQLEPGPVATPFEHRPIGTELALCQRYYQTMGDIYLSPIKSDNTLGASFPRTVDMRTTPTESADFSKVIGGLINGTSQKWNVSATSYFDTNTANVLKPKADAEL